LGVKRIRDLALCRWTPFAEIPLSKHHPKLVFAMQMESDQGLPHVHLDRIWRDPHPRTLPPRNHKNIFSYLILFCRLKSNSSFGFKLTEVDKVNKKPSKD
jgi:hypothetical protein